MAIQSLSRIADLLCEQCTVRCQRRWPVASDSNHLLHHCPRCTARCHRVCEARNSESLHFRLLPDLTPAEVDAQAATHEAAHAVVGILVNLPLRQVALADHASGQAWRGMASAATTFDAYTVPRRRTSSSTLDSTATGRSSP